ncbi:hypothetical protein CRE_12104 [Caenorhabditis remanei]|uniref:Uncharacterized protein n=1 Tax=Caenorhabditis remanei TaxID=31234 RepID=E3MPX2_CAERE|nr:hypothetical protein CRE_12104 [Caenorhabditis remanei]
MYPIPFLKLPYLIQLDVLKQLEFDVIFLMSLCSKKVKIMIQGVNLEVPKLVYGLIDSLTQACVGHHEDLQLRRDVTIFKCLESIPRDEMSQMNLAGNTIECSYKKQLMNGKEMFVVGYHAADEETVLKSLQFHVSSLFRNKPLIVLIAVLPSALTKSTIIADLSEAVIDNRSAIFNIEPGMLHTSELEDFINALTVHDAGQRTSEIMANFDGKCLHLSKAIYTTNDWIQLLRKWKRKEACGNLKLLGTHPPEQLPIMNFDVTEFDLQVWDGLRRPKYYKFTHLRSMDVDCSNWLDMQQDGGGKWASVMLEQDFKFFVVWD